MKNKDKKQKNTPTFEPVQNVVQPKREVVPAEVSKPMPQMDLSQDNVRQMYLFHELISAPRCKTLKF